MKPQKPAFYVYGYYDPRTLRLFYVGKGKGGRKAAHLAGTDPGAKSTTITAIHRAGLRPIIKVLASRLSEREALLVEKTMIWALGHQLTNRSSGQLADRFRPVDSLHSDLPGFDSNCGVYLVNVGEGPNRSWDDCRKYGFLAAGGGRNWSDQLERLSPGDIVVAYLKGHGYVGVARVLSPRCPSAPSPSVANALALACWRSPASSDELTTHACRSTWSESNGVSQWSAQRLAFRRTPLSSPLSTW